MTTTEKRPVLDLKTAQTILHTLDELREYAGLSQAQIDLKRQAKAALAYWTAQGVAA